MIGPAEFAIRNRLISTLVILAAVIAGWLAYQNMPRFEDPEFTIRTAVVTIPYPGATPEEVANEVTETMEAAIQQMQEVDEIRSVSKAGIASINVDIKYDFSPSKESLQSTWVKLRNKVQDVADSGVLPPGAANPIVNDDFGDVYGLYYLLTGEGFAPAELYQYAKRLRTELLAVDGVAKVKFSGVQSEAIYVEISRERASALGVSVDSVYNDLAQQNSVLAAGNVQLGDLRLTIHPSGSVDSVRAIENVVVSAGSSGDLVYLRDIATVRRDYKDPSESIVRFNGRPALAMGVSNVLGANVVKMGEGIERALKESESRRPLGIEIHEYYHQGKIVDLAVKDFAFNVLMALVIVLVTLLIFMGLQSAIVIGAVLLLTIAATLGTMYWIGIPMHRISLGALIIALGMLVDNAIVVAEGILVGTQQGRKKLDIAKEIVTRTKWPLLGGTLVGTIAFAPIGFAPGSTAEFTGHLFWVVMISLLYSWIFAITAVPLFADLLFKESNREPGPAADGKFYAAFKNFIGRVLVVRWLVIGGAAAMFVVSVWGFQFVKAGFFPASTTPQIVVDYWLPPGTDISRTNADMAEIETTLAKFDGVKDIQTLVGQGGIRYMLVYSSEPPDSSYGQFLIKTENYEQIPQIMPKIQQFLDQNYLNAQAKVWQFALGPGGGSKIEAAFKGPDPDVLRDLVSQAKAIMVADGKAISIKDDWRPQVSVIQPLYSEVSGRRLGISREDLAGALQTNYSGRNVGLYREGDELIPIIARAPAVERQGVDGMGGIEISSPATGNAVPLIEVVDGFQTIWRNSKLLRVDRVWTIKAQADPVQGELASSLLSRLMPQIEAIELPDGYSLEWKGEFGDSAESNQNLASTLPMGLLAMVLVVVVLFNAIKQPLVIWLVVPLALIGVVVGLLVTNTPMEFMAILGLLSLSGLLIKNAIVLVDQMDLEIREGKPRFDAVVDSATSRVRPVMMGSLTTVLGVIPLFFDAFFKSMAVVLVFGLTFATLLTLIVLPALYAIFFRISPSESAASQALGNDDV